jgi:hypothetical protein
MSQLEVDKVIPQSGTTLTLGESGDTITIASGATFTPTLTAPIIDEINDNNGNEEIIFTTTSSAVNELTIANAATGNAPEIAATGDDTDIDLKLTPKGAGNLVLDGIEFPNADGSANQVLQTNGSGVLSFATVGGGTQEFAAGSASTPSITTTGDTNTGIFFPAADTIAFAKGGSEIMRITSAGQVAIGTTGSPNGSRFAIDNANPNGTSDVGWGIDTNGGGYWAYTNQNTYWNNTSVGDAFINIRYRGSTVGSIKTGTTNVAYNTTSDYRLKNNISNVLNAIDRVKQLKPIRFSFIVEPDKIVDGFLAHEVQEVVPEAITGTKDATETYIDEQGNEQTKPLYQAIDQSKLVPLLTAGLQEAIAKIETLEARITALENN